jgi:hypothetical protein
MPWLTKNENNLLYKSLSSERGRGSVFVCGEGGGRRRKGVGNIEYPYTLATDFLYNKKRSNHIILPDNCWWVKLVLATLPKEDHGPECLVNNKQLFNL